MRLPPFEHALADLARRMEMNPVELLQHVASLKTSLEPKKRRVELEPPDGYIEAAEDDGLAGKEAFDSLLEGLSK